MEPTTPIDQIQVKNRITDPFARVLNDIIEFYGPAMGAYGVAVYTVYARFANYKTNECFPSLNTVCKILSVSKPKLIETNLLLENLGLLKKTTRWNKDGSPTSNLYELLPPTLPIPGKVINDHFPKDFVPNYTNLSGKHLYTLGTEQALSAGGGSKQSLPPQAIKESTDKGGSKPHLPPPSKPGLPLQSTELTTVVSHVYSNEKKINEKNLKRNNNSDVVILEIKDVFEACRKYSQKVSWFDLNRWWNKALEKTQDPKKAKAFLWEQLAVADEQKKNLGDFIPWFNTAVERGYHSRLHYEAEKKAIEQKIKEQEQEQRRLEREEADRDYAADMQKRKTATNEDILKYFKGLPEFLKLDQKLRMVKSRFDGVNPNFEEVYNVISAKGGKHGA